MYARITIILVSSVCLFMSTGVSAQSLPDLKIVNININPKPPLYMQYPALKAGTRYQMTLHVANTLPVNVYQDVELVVHFRCLTECGGPLPIDTHAHALKGISGDGQKRWSFNFIIPYPGNYSLTATVDERDLIREKRDDFNDNSWSSQFKVFWPSQ